MLGITLCTAQTYTTFELPEEEENTPFKGIELTQENLNQFEWDEQPITTNRFKEDLNQKYSGAAFQYQEKSAVKKTTPVKINKVSRFTITMQVLGVLAILALIVFILYVLISNKRNWIGKEKDLKNVVSVLNPDEEHVENMDLDTLLERALNQQNYRLAIRYQYLKTLKLLTQKNIISYHVKKTNLDYLEEITSEKHKQEFSYLSYLYNYIWYGEFNITQPQYQNAAKSFHQFLKNNSETR